jgi:protoporphyrinogen oxidase
VAAHLGEPCEVLEGDERPGGHCQSVCEDGFTFDAGGPHIMFSRNRQTLDFMVSLLGDNVRQSRRNNKIFYRGRYVKYPFENGLYDLEPQDRYECLLGCLKNDAPPPTNFKEWMYHTFGQGITEKYMLPYNEKIWKIDAGQMNLDWVDGRVPRPPVEDIVKAAVGVETEGYTHQLYFYYPERGGIESLPAGMAQRVENITTEFPIRNVRRHGDKWTVSDGRGERDYSRVVATIPIHELVNIVEGVPREIQECVGRLRYNSLITVTVAVASTSIPDYTAIYVPEPSLIFHRLSFPAVFSPSNAPAGVTLIQAEITVNSWDPLWTATDAELVKQVVAGLESMELVKPSEVCYEKVVRTRYGYVVQDFHIRTDLKVAKAYFEEIGMPLCGRVAEFEYINMDQCIERGIAVAERLNKGAYAGAGCR